MSKYYDARTEEALFELSEVMERDRNLVRMWRAAVEREDKEYVIGRTEANIDRLREIIYRLAEDKGGLEHCKGADDA